MWNAYANELQNQVAQYERNVEREARQRKRMMKKQVSEHSVALATEV